MRISFSPSTDPPFTLIFFAANVLDESTDCESFFSLRAFKEGVSRRIFLLALAFFVFREIDVIAFCVDLSSHAVH